MVFSDAFESYRNNKLRVQKWVSLFLNAICETENKVLLDCGCGVGRFAIPLSVYFKSTIGVDNDPSMLNTAREKDGNIHWIGADVCNIPLEDQSVDVVLVSMLIEHLDSLEKFIDEINRLIKKDGVLLLRTMLPSDIDNTTWYHFSEKAYQMELDRTYGFESLSEYFSNRGFRLSYEHSIFNIVESFSNSNIVDKLVSRSYEILYHLTEEDYNELICRAKNWQETSNNEENMSSSLLDMLIFSMKWG